MKHRQTGTVQSKQWLTESVFELCLVCHEFPLSIQPGQFLELSCHGREPVFLNRPFSPFYHQDQQWHFLIQKKGRGTTNLADLEKHDSVTVLAPLGKPFPAPSPKASILCIAGGVGLAPIYYYLSTYLPKIPQLSITLLYGTTREEDNIVLPNYQDAITIYHHADQSLSGYAGNLFDYYLTLPQITFDQAIICGPLPMMKTFSNHFIKENKTHYVSLETIMACGMGFCKGCSISTAVGMKTVCNDGPVFDGCQLDWNML